MEMMSNPLVWYALCLVGSFLLYLLYLRLTAKNTITFKIGMFFTPTLLVACYTSFAFGISYNYLLFIPALICIFVSTSLIGRNIQIPIKMIVEDINSLAQGDLNKAESLTFSSRKDEFGLLVQHIETMRVNINDVVCAIADVASGLNEFSSNVIDTSMQISTSAEQLASNTEEISSSTEEISSNFEQSQDFLQKTSSLIKESEVNIDDSKNLAIDMEQSMQKIAEKISIINEIASRTNLLAINAAVEAARAGTHGRGFAVVANEVKMLSDQSNTAAKEINSITAKGVDLSKENDDLLDKTVPNFQRVVVNVAEISNAITEQVHGLGQINNSLQELSTISQNNSVSVGSLKTLSEHLSNYSVELNKRVSYFKREEDALLN